MRYYLIGICGISMSALAHFLNNSGNEVSGSDMNVSGAKSLERNGVKVFHNENVEEVAKADVVVVSSAIGEDNADLKIAKKLKKKVLSRGELLGELSKNYEKVIAVAGSHGKTTTTALIYNVLKCAKVNPSLHLGGVLCEEKTNYVVGDTKYFVTEACEYHDNFLFLHPYIGVVTNVEEDHLDYFKTFENELKSFEKFKSNCKYVIDGSRLYPTHIRYDRKGRLCFNIAFDDSDDFSISHQRKLKKLISLKVQILEEVNVYNCILAYHVCALLGFSDEIIKEGIESFKGVKRRFEKVDCEYFENVIVDYAHHPTEIENTIKTAKKVFKNKKILYIFQPHTYSRTKNLLNEFVEVFKKVDDLILYKTYPSREKTSDGISALKLAKILDVSYCANLNSLMKKLFVDYNDRVLVFIGAGDLPDLLYKNKFLRD